MAQEQLKRMNHHHHHLVVRRLISRHVKVGVEATGYASKLFSLKRNDICFDCDICGRDVTIVSFS